jgi:hypothetical protein
MMGTGGMNQAGMGDGMKGCGNGQQCPGPIFMALLNQHKQISREVKKTDQGIESLTESKDPEVAALIKTHVAQMRELLASCQKGQCSHTPAYFDPLFRAVYSNADKLDLQVGCWEVGMGCLPVDCA